MTRNRAPGYRPRIARKHQRKRPERRRIAESEPTPNPEDTDWLEWGDELILSMGETSGGAPYGLREAEFRQMNARYDPARPWAIAKNAFLTALDRVAAPDAHTSVDYVESLGKGISRHGFTARLTIDPDPHDLSGQYVALLAHRDADPEYPARVRREMRVLEWLSPRIRYIRVPSVLALIDDEPAPILIVRHVPGLEVDLRHGRLPIHPWHLVADVASAIHAAPLPPADILPPRDRKQHRSDVVHALFDALADPPAVIADAAAWMREHVEHPGPGVLLHGDLLGQNLRVHPELRPGVIDWEYAEIGDPAHDLAIVTRGARQPFRIASGAEKLLAAYDADSRVEVDDTDLRFFELALHVRLCRGTLSQALESHAILARLLREA